MFDTVGRYCGVGECFFVEGDVGDVFDELPESVELEAAQFIGG